MITPGSRFFRAVAFFSLLIFGAAAAHAAHHEKAMAPVGFKAIVVLVEGNDSGVSGTVTFEQTAKGVRVVADVMGLTPGKHGFHVHQKGDLSAANLTSTGGHYNPAGHDHAGPMAAKRHVGDLGNLTADASGHATADFVDTELALAGDHSIIGRGVIVHAGEDDLTSQPTGAAGGRVAGGVIGIIGMP
ncbi:superoxide dismutase family protein [Synoicihabitans lomoniglobus]|uniref:Superoxide dismutase family protein n=1 Tax=Synoicihabitans lomoniglobus TaxID=2909285 RepID=A0AAF0A0S5_9BACT|nr:superoxide dismutase family protein [Opitutaceae bacterium LMO-M01]WED65233.1 superoxide dismutase family protein [Opitutaceae bacterium LMO-M01]